MERKYFKEKIDSEAEKEKIYKKQEEFLRKRRELQGLDVKTPDYESPLDQDVMKVKGGDIGRDVTPSNVVMNNIREKITTNEPMRTTSGTAWSKKIDALRGALKGAGKGLKMIPGIGTIASVGGALMGSEDASAAVPILDSAESTGPTRDSLEGKLEAGTITPEEREELRRQALANISKYRN